MLLLQFMIYRRWLDVPKMLQLGQQDELEYSTYSTVINIIITFYYLWAESRSLREDLFEYSLLSMKAKLDWVPYGNQLKHCKIGKDVDFSLIEIKLPFITNMIGYYDSILYQFTDESLKKLASFLEQASYIRHADQFDEDAIARSDRRRRRQSVSMLQSRVD